MLYRILTALELLYYNHLRKKYKDGCKITASVIYSLAEVKVWLFALKANNHNN